MAEGKPARLSEIYPCKLCRAILQGCKNQLVRDGSLKTGMHGLQGEFEEDVTKYYDSLTGAPLEGADRAAAERVFAVQQMKHEGYKDSVTGQPLQTELVQAARKLEL